MSLEEWQLNVQVENSLDFISLAHHGCDLRDNYQAQDLMDYCGMLNGPTYLSLVRHFWVRAQVYDRKASQLELNKKKMVVKKLRQASLAAEVEEEEEVATSLVT